jgi:hypothetical protein
MAALMDNIKKPYTPAEGDYFLFVINLYIIGFWTFSNIVSQSS